MFRSWIARVFSMSSRPSRRSLRTARRVPVRSFRPSLEVLEARSLLSVTPVSIATSGSAMGNAPSSTIQGAVSANGQYEVFSSSATDLVSGATINALSTNVYRRDLVHGTTSLVSVDSTGTAGVPAGYSASGAVITADGRYVAFSSNATDLTSNDTQGGVFVRDMAQGQTYLVSSNYQGPNPPTIGEGNGQLAIAFTAYEGNSPLQVYVSTLQLNSSTGDIQYSSLKKTLVSADSSGQDGNWSSSAPVLSQDGSTLMFNSQATDLNVPGGYFDGQPTTPTSSGVANLFLYSLSSQTLKLLSAEPTTGTNATGNSGSSLAVENIASAAPPVSAQTVSSNGQYVVFTSGSDNLVGGVPLSPGVTSNVYWRDLKAGKTQMVSISTSGTGIEGSVGPSPAITPDGRYVAFFTREGGGSGVTSNDSSGGIFVRDMTQGQTYMVSNNATTGNGLPDAVPSIAENSNGQLVIAYMVSDSSGNAQVYVSTLDRDSKTGVIQPNTLTTKLVSATSSGNGGNSSSINPMLSKDGSTLAFLSYASNLNGETGKSQPNNLPLLFAYNVAAGTLTQVSAGVEPNAQVPLSSVSISDHGDIAYVLVDADSQGDTVLYGWNASTGTNTAIPIVPYPQGNKGLEYGVGDNVSISGDGSTVAFNEYDVFGHGYVFAAGNWQSGTPTDTQISPSVGATINGNTVYSADVPSISDNGQVISFDLSYGSGPIQTTQVFVYNKGTTTEASKAYNGGDSSGGFGLDPAAVSSDGSTVVFNSTAYNLFPKTTFDFTDFSNITQVYAYSVTHNKVSLVSAKAPGSFTVDGWVSDTGPGSLSDTGRYVAFTSFANDIQSDLAPGSHVFAEDVQKGVPTLVSGFGPDATPEPGEAVISGNGSTVAYLGNTGPLTADIYSRNWLAGKLTTTLLSINSAGTGGSNGWSEYPSISDNGQVIAFDSNANNLTGNDADAGGYTQIFVRNLATKKTILASPNSSGTDGGNGNSTTALLSADGSTVVFNSQATNLVAGVTVPSTPPNNVYALTLGASAANVSSDVSIALGSLSYNPTRHEYTQTVTITNTSGATLLGPLALLLTNLSSNATLANASGTWLGDPYINFVTPSGHLAAGQSITVTLYFKAPANSSITYSAEVWQNI